VIRIKLWLHRRATRASFWLGMDIFTWLALLLAGVVILLRLDGTL
jgi:hypothetical protein